jgi:hypothetical protein
MCPSARPDRPFARVGRRWPGSGAVECRRVQGPNATATPTNQRDDRECRDRLGRRAFEVAGSESGDIVNEIISSSLNTFVGPGLCPNGVTTLPRLVDRHGYGS